MTFVVTVALFLLLFSFTYLYILYLFYLLLYSFHSLFIINLLLLLIILGFWGVLVFWVGVCLGLGLMCVEISMVVGIFVGVRLGEWNYIIGVGGSGLEVG